MPTLSLNASKKTKHTPAGEIPVDWGWARTQEICSRISVGIVIAPSQYYTDAEDGTLAFRSANVREGKINDSNWVHLNQEGHRKNQKSELKEGDVLIVRTGAPGVACVVSKEFEGSNCIDLVIARPDRHQVASDYLCLFFNSDCGRRQAFSKQGGLAQKHLNVGAVAKLTIPLPPLPEQHRIAAILSTWDRAIETLESLIAAKDRRKQALMQQLLTGRKRLPGFGGNWPVKHLGDVARNVSLRNNGRFDWDRLYAVTKAEGMIPMREQVMGITTKNCKLVKRDHFAYNPMRLNIGSLARWQKDEEVMVSGDYIVFECIEGGLEPRFFDHLRRTPQWHDFVNTGGSGSVRVRLYFKDIAPFRFPCPSYKEQEALADLFDTIDRELTLHRQHLATLRTQKRGLMQKLLTGQVRVAP